MSVVNGVKVTGTLVPTDTSDTYPVTDPQYALGGFRSVPTFADRAAIPLSRCRQGMVVVVQEDTGGGPNQAYQLQTLPDYWILFPQNLGVIYGGTF